jgi:hypothetical protein
VKDAQSAKENLLVAADLGHACALVYLGKLFDKADPQRFVWLGRAAVSSAEGTYYVEEILDQIRNFSSGLEMQRLLSQSDEH